MSNYYKVNFKIIPYNSDAADLLAAFLADIGFESFEESETGVNAYIQELLLDEMAIRDILSSFSFGVEITWKKQFIEHTDWNEEWERKYFQPLVIGDGKCVVHSTFHKEYPCADYDIIIDPKMAFGTGHHSTTTMMANHLFNIDLKGKKVVDMGTGTGILAILANKLGAVDVTGIEIDSAAYDNAIENANLNNAQIKIVLGDSNKLEDLHAIDVFLANINRNIILADLDRYVKTLHSESIILLSGFYSQDVNMLEKALISNGIKIEEVVETGDSWASIKGIKG